MEAQERIRIRDFSDMNLRFMLRRREGRGMEDQVRACDGRMDQVRACDGRI